MLSLFRNIEQTASASIHLLTIDGYARLDLRVTPKNEVYFIEANPNPILAADEGFRAVRRESEPILSPVD